MYADRRINTRKRILRAAHTLINRKGYSSTSIHDILLESHITKGGFFYHFKAKNDLAKELVESYLDNIDRALDIWFGQADAFSDDPLQRMFKLLDDISGTLKDIPEDDFRVVSIVAGCIYENHEFGSELKQMLKKSVDRLRERLIGTLQAIERCYSPRLPTDHGTLSDMFLSILNGGITLSTVAGKNTLAGQIDTYRDAIKLIYDAPVVLNS
ncbi:TetR/AcrR family transcriptional regulator [Exilibacterium tricleocarpae]|uniref:TetR/AcrR family transcriptional regulator n=1 Tax=Exilibacterium tricleocarpae TaxID=2591008 RepID=A0A545T3L9_9GAMM|nr:TetR/AcrR family transcriptional regulator [Exilibacterium tricleocarpae]TQV71806.1 TetR/AcrR family transcriptional regulator [Exilibacterium tricleocarpae]